MELVKHILSEFNKVTKEDPRYKEKRYFVITMLESQIQPVFITKGKNIIIKQAEDCEEEKWLLAKLKKEIREEEGVTSEAKILKFQ